MAMFEKILKLNEKSEWIENFIKEYFNIKEFYLQLLVSSPTAMNVNTLKTG